MKYNLIARGLCSLLFVGCMLLVSSCSSGSDNNVTLPQKATLTVTAIAGGTNRTTLTEADGSTSQWTWNAGDKLYVVDATGGVLGSLTLASASAGQPTGTFTGDITGIAAQSYYFWYLGSGNTVANGASTFTLDLSSQSGAITDLGKYDVMAGSATVTQNGSNYSVGSLTLSKLLCDLHLGVSSSAGAVSSVSLSGTGVKSSVTFNLKDNATPTTVDGTVTVATTGNYYVAFYPAAVTPVFKAAVGSKMYTTASSLNWSLAAGMLYRGNTTTSGSTITIACNTRIVPEGALTGSFSVSATKTVLFSQGDLQYQASSTTWRFASNQYDYIGSAAGNTTAAASRSTQSDWIDLFAWGASGYSNIYPYLSTGSTSYYSEASDISGTQYDWGVHCAISNGGNAAGLWRTLTSSEWNYILSSRTNASSKRALATVNGKAGLVILPDSWTLPSSCTFTATISNYTTNTYTTTQWAYMELAGALFLPAAGSRSGTSVSSPGSVGFYWSSTANGTSYAYSLHFYGSYLQPLYTGSSRNSGRSVRLAHDE